MLRAVANRLATVQPGAASDKIGVHIANGEQRQRLIMLWDDFASDGWRPAVTGLRATSCDLQAGGFRDGAWNTARQDMIRDLEQRASAMATVPNVELAIHAVADQAAGGLPVE